MKLTPLQVYRTPDYPTEEAVRRDRALLRAVPRRWIGNRVVLGSLAGLLALMEQSVRAEGKDQPTLRVAPIFEHGEGKGAFGCVAVNPPTFLTEDEAREVIEDEARKAGLEFTERNHWIDNVPVPYVERYVVWEYPILEATPTPSADGKVVKWKKWRSSDLTKYYSKKGPEQTREVIGNETVVLSGWSPVTQIGYRFVAQQDFGGRPNNYPKSYAKNPDGTLKDISSGGGSSTASGYNVLDAAKRLTKGLSQTPMSGTVAVFYDPLARPKTPPPLPVWKAPENGKELSPEELEARQKEWLAYSKVRDASSKAASAEELRLQVRDFLAWLKAQGVM